MKLKAYYQSSLAGTAIAIYLFLVIALALSILIFLLDDFLPENQHFGAIGLVLLALLLMALGESANYQQKLRLYFMAMALYLLELINEFMIWQGAWSPRLNYYTQENLFASMGVFWGILYFSFRFLAFILPFRYAHLVQKMKAIDPQKE